MANDYTDKDPENTPIPADTQDVDSQAAEEEEAGLTQEEYEAAETMAEQAAAGAAVAGGSVLREVYEWVQAIAIAIVLALLINHFLFSIVQVDGSSMEPTLEHGQRLIVSKLLYEPQNGDIVIIKSSRLKKFIVKRVIAVEGQTVDLDPRTGDVTVDGEVLEEPYIKEKLRSAGSVLSFPLTVAEDTVFVMGDNRNNSLDSRAIGLIPRREVVGKAVFRIWPLSAFGGLSESK